MDIDSLSITILLIANATILMVSTDHFDGSYELPNCLGDLFDLLGIAERDISHPSRLLCQAVAGVR